MLQKTKKVVLVGVMTITTLGLIGCGKNSDVQKTSNVNNGAKSINTSVDTVNNHSNHSVTKKQINDVRQKLEEVKSKKRSY